MLWFLRFGSIGPDCLDGINGNHWWREQFAGAGDILGTFADSLKTRVMLKSELRLRLRAGEVVRLAAPTMLRLADERLRPARSRSCG